MKHSTESDDLAAQPEGCQTIADPRGQGMTLIVPPIGFWRARKGPFLFTILWLGFTTMMTVQFTGRAGGRSPSTVPGSWVGVVLFLSAFWSAGLFLTAIVIQAAWTRTILTLHGAFFSLTLEGPFRTSRKRLLCTDMVGFDIERSSLPADKSGRGIPHLRLRVKNWPRGIGILAGRDQSELRWVASVMSKALKEVARQNPQLVPDVFDQPASSRAIVARRSDGVTLKLPAPGLRGAIAAATVGGLLASVVLLASAWALANAADQPWTASTWFGICTTMVLGLFALAVAVEAIGYAFRRDELTAEGHLLTTSHTTWWAGFRAKSWRRSQIAAINVDVGTNPLPRLRIHQVSGRAERLLLYRDENELLWVATLLREALHVPANLQR